MSIIITVITIIDDVDNDDDDEFLKRKIGSEGKKLFFPLKVTQHCKQRLFNTTA